MAGSLLVPRTHARSVSLPSGPHLAASQVHVCLQKLKVSEVTCSSEAISRKLNGLVDLYECVDELLKLKSTQETILNECRRGWVDQVMDGSLRLLDVCGVAKDVLLQTKECTQDFQSVLRRKRGDRTELAWEVSKYKTSRRNVKKTVQRSLKKLMSQESEKNHEDITVAKMLFGAEHAALKVFGSLLSFVSGSSAQLKDSKWCFISKLMLSKPVVGVVDADEVCDFATVDAALQNLSSQMACEFTYLDGQNLQHKMADLELIIQDLEEAMERIFRHQIRTRVSLLNILSR
uniref:Uncharacterized protein n=1 Tax=Kalanchoe fedtschenkoi TaxID=63787 RepID=A0A7N0UWF8_KALFE